MDFNAGMMLAERARLEPNKLALLFEGGSFSYRELNQRSNCWANALLDFGLKKGDRVGFLLMNCNEFLEAFFGLAKVGAVLVMLNWRLAPPELEYIAKDGDLNYLIYGEEFTQTVDMIRPRLGLRECVCVGQSQTPSWAKSVDTIVQYPPTEPKSSGGGDDPVLILYTSGTTGRPKGAVFTHDTVFWYCVNTLLSFDPHPEDRMLVILPLFHIPGLLASAAANVYRGSTTVLMKTFDPLKALEIVQAEKCTEFVAAPTILQRMAQVPNFERYLNSVRWCHVTGSPLPVSLLQTYLQRGIMVLNSFGSTETGSGSIMRPEKVREKPASAGLAPFHHEIRVVDDAGVDVALGQVGELVVKGPLRMKEYWRNPQATAEIIKDGWIHTGDLARLDEEGFLYIVDRKKDMIISGGENIYPAEIENVLAVHPKIQEVAVIGQPDESWGESPCAVVRPKPGETLTTEDIIGFCQGKIGRYKIPKRVILTDQPLPRTPAGKVLKHVLREQVGISIDKAIRQSKEEERSS